MAEQVPLWYMECTKDIHAAHIASQAMKYEKNPEKTVASQGFCSNYTHRVIRWV